MGELDADGNPSEEAAKATYVPFCTELDTVGLACVKLMRYWPGMDMGVEGNALGVNWDCIGQLRPLLKNAAVFASANFTPEESEDWIRQKRVDAVVIGRPLLYNTNYAEKVQAGGPMSYVKSNLAMRTGSSKYNGPDQVCILY